MRMSLPLLILALLGVQVISARAAETTPEEADRAVAISLLSPAERAARADERAERGAALLDAGRYQEARRLLRQALDYDPDHAEARELLERTEQYLAAYGEIPGAAVEGAIRREKISVEQRLIEARYLLRTAESALAEAAEPVGGDLMARANALEGRQRALSRAADAAERAGLQLAGLPARIDTEEERETLYSLNQRIRVRRTDLLNALDQAQRQIAMQKVEEARTRVEATEARRREFQIEKARSFLEGRRYEEAEEIVRQILVASPADSEAGDLLRRIQEEAIRYHMRVETEETQEERKRVQERTRRAAIPEITLQDRLKYPPDWEEIQRAKEADDLAGTESREDRAVREALMQRISVEFDNDDITDILDELRNRDTGVDFLYIPPSIAVPEPVSLELRNMRMESILDHIIRKAGLEWTVRDGVVVISGAEDIQGAAYSKVYNTLDLVTRVRNASEMEGGQGITADDSEDEDMNLGEVISNILEQEFTDAVEAKALLNERGWLSVYGTPDIHERVVELLSQLRSASQIQVAVNARLMRVANDFWTDFDSDFVPQRYGEGGFFSPPYSDIRLWPGGSGGRFLSSQMRHIAPSQVRSFLPTTYLDDDAATTTFGLRISQFGYLQAIHADWFIRAAKESGKIDQLFAPHLIVYNNRSGWVLFQNARTIVDDYSINGPNLTQETTEITEVRGLEVRPTVSADKRYITLTINPQVSQILSVEQAMIRYTLTIPDVDSRTFELPMDLAQTLEWEVATTATIPDGGSMILSGMSINVESRTRNGIPIVQDLPVVGNAFSRRANQQRIDDLMVLVSARMILLDEEEARQTR